MGRTTFFMLEQEQKRKAEKDKQEPESVNYPKSTGGGWYELSNGESVRGKEKAIEAEKELSDA